METRQIDVSRLAELSTVALLAGKVRLSLDAVKRGQQPTTVQLKRISRGIRYLDRLLEGLGELAESVDVARVAGPAKLHAIDSYLIAAPALSVSTEMQPQRRITADDIQRWQAFLQALKSTLEALTVGSRSNGPAVQQADEFFAKLARHAREEQGSMLRSYAP